MYGVGDCNITGADEFRQKISCYFQKLQVSSLDQFVRLIVFPILKGILSDVEYKHMSPYQIRTKPGHRVLEHLFVIKSVIYLLFKIIGNMIGK